MNNQSTRPHWARAMTKTLVQIRDLKELVAAFINLILEINLLFLDFYRKGEWPTNTIHGWNILATTRAIQYVCGACTSVKVRIGDVELHQHFFLQELASHSIIIK